MAESDQREQQQQQQQQQSDSYPSPANANAGSLPFYQQLEHEIRQHDSAADRDNDDTREQSNAAQHSASADAEAALSGQRRDTSIDDRPDLANYSNIANFGNFGGLPAAMMVQTAQNGAAALENMPHTPPAYGQSNGAEVDSAPQSAADKNNRDKRTKVSRACDECRRKKIRCDSSDESGNTPCANCVRTHATCAFSRQPMKRGPSKGYIKELAERLNSLEQQVHPPHMQQQYRYEIEQIQQAMVDGGHQPQPQQPYYHDPRLVPDPRTGEKRTHDMAEALHSHQRPSSSGMPMGGNYQPQPPAPGAMQPFWRQQGYPSQDSRRDAFEVDSSVNISTATFDWDEAVIDEYYRVIHQTFPLLPNNKNRLRQRLTDCPASLREAFLAALDSLMRTFPTSTLEPGPNYAQALKRCAELLAKYPFDNPSTHNNATNLVYLQTLILMALESDNHGPATIRGQAGPSRAEWLGRAAGVAGQLEINVIRTTSQSMIQGDRDSEERLARRVWWVLFILDRWHASSTADLLKLPENSVVLLPEDQILLGESTYNLARLSFIIGHLAAILTTTKTPSTDVMAPSNPASSLLGMTLAGEIDRFRESVESVWGSLNLVHLSYHHCHLLIKRLNPMTEPSELVGHAVKVATMLNSRLTPVTPLNHHFGALAAMTLCELCDVAKTRTEAMKGLDQMEECLGAGRGLAGKQESEGWDGAVRELVRKKKEKLLQQGADGLHGLADAAVGGADEAKFDPTLITRYGYLTSLGQGVFGREGM